MEIQGKLPLFHETDISALLIEIINSHSGDLLPLEKESFFSHIQASKTRTRHRVWGEFMNTPTAILISTINNTGYAMINIKNEPSLTFWGTFESQILSLPHSLFKGSKYLTDKGGNK